MLYSTGGTVENYKQQKYHHKDQKYLIGSFFEYMSEHNLYPPTKLYHRILISEFRLLMQFIASLSKTTVQIIFFQCFS